MLDHKNSSILWTIANIKWHLAVWVVSMGVGGGGGGGGEGGGRGRGKGRWVASFALYDLSNHLASCCCHLIAHTWTKWEWVDTNGESLNTLMYMRVNEHVQCMRIRGQSRVRLQAKQKLDVSKF